MTRKEPAERPQHGAFSICEAILKKPMFEKIHALGCWALGCGIQVPQVLVAFDFFINSAPAMKARAAAIVRQLGIEGYARAVEHCVGPVQRRRRG